MEAPRHHPELRWIVLYDRDCGFCRSSLALLLCADRERRLYPVALETPQADELLADLTPEQREASWHLISPDGRRASAGAGLAAVLGVIPGGRIPAAALARAPTTTERAYRWVAEHRSQLGRWLPSSAKRRATAIIDARARETA
jgi:predicted DCC family thiol-disulfide oxidoreductase YuxK